MRGVFLESISKQVEYYKQLGEQAIEQVPDEMLYWRYNEESNSMATIINHLSGNMVSRWTDFLLSDGEKDWRDRDAEFRSESCSKEEMLAVWSRGWTVFLKTLHALEAEDLKKIVYIRREEHSVIDAIHRQLAHYSYHIGQLVYIGKMCSHHWTSLSIPKGKSQEFNEARYSGREPGGSPRNDK